MTIREPIPRGEIVEECDARFEVFALPTDEGTLLAILKDCFEEWEHIHIVPLIPGALWEIRPPHKPRITMLDGYATVDFQDWHFHICIGEHGGASPEMTKLRRTSRVELYRRLNQEQKPTSWGLRLLNGARDQQLTFMLPSPFLTDDQRWRAKALRSVRTFLRWRSPRQRLVTKLIKYSLMVAPKSRG